MEFLSRTASVSFPALVLLSLWLQEMFTCVIASEKVYFDKYGHCIKGKVFDLSDEEYTAISKGGGLRHESLDCSLSFKASPGYGVCVTFKKFEIKDCNVQFLIYEAKNSDGEEWKVLSCDMKGPSQMCTSGRYLTLRVLKSRLNHNRGYEMKLKVEKSYSVTDEGVVFVSIALVVGVICGVVIFIVLSALIVYCCCCKKRQESTTAKKVVSCDNNEQAQPSAPPLLETDDFGYAHGRGPTSHLYPTLQEKPMLDAPPPYEQPPLYSPHDVHSK